MSVVVFVPTPPQLRVLARSFPVPSGKTATGGWGFNANSSRQDRIQPTWFNTYAVKDKSQLSLNIFQSTLFSTVLMVYVFLTTHSAVTSTGQNLQVVDFTIQLQAAS